MLPGIIHTSKRQLRTGKVSATGIAALPARQSALQRAFISTYFRSAINYTCFMAKWISQFLLLLIAVTLGSCNDQGSTNTITSINVDSEQQISASDGNFNGVLLDDDRFGSAVALIGDLEVGS